MAFSPYKNILNHNYYVNYFFYLNTTNYLNTVVILTSTNFAGTGIVWKTLILVLALNTMKFTSYLWNTAWLENRYIFQGYLQEKLFWANQDSSFLSVFFLIRFFVLPHFASVSLKYSLSVYYVSYWSFTSYL